MKLSSQRPTRTNTKRIVGFATQGHSSADEERLSVLLSQLPVEIYPFQKDRKGKQLIELMQYLRRERPDLVVMEGTGTSGGLALIVASLFWGIHYVVSSGDAVGPYVRRITPTLGPLFSAYERTLCRLADGFIGWSPYLAGRALTFGCQRAMTAPGWAPIVKSVEELSKARVLVRQRLGIPDKTIVFGLVGSLRWNSRVRYSYGAELIQALTLISRNDVAVIIVGDGSGRPQLEKLAGGLADNAVFFTGRIARNDVPDYLAAMDVASLPQSTDGVGSFRYTTKISEYVAAKIPIVSGQLPMTYDLPNEWFWRISGEAPWKESYIVSLAELMAKLTLSDVQDKRSHMLDPYSFFCQEEQVARVTQFILDTLQKRRVKNFLSDNV